MTVLDNKHLLEGFNHACDASKLTLGANGKIAMIEGNMGVVAPTKDGVTVCKSVFFNSDVNDSEEVKLEKKQKQMGATLAKQIAAKTVTEAGDNTTTSLVFAQAIVQQSLNVSDITIREVIEGVDLALEDIKVELALLAENADKTNLKDIAYISSNGDEEIATTLIEAYDKANIVDIVEADSPKTTLKSLRGMTVDKGYLSPLLTTKDSNLTFEETDVDIVLLESPLGISNIDIVDKVLDANTPAVIMVEDISEDALNAIINVHSRGRHICVIKAPDFGHERKQLMKDLAIYTNCEVYVPGVSKSVVKGKADKVIISKDKSYFIQNELSTEAVSYLSSLKSVEDKNEFIEKRIANFENGVSTIFVGGKTDSEIKEKKDRFDDAKCALQNAIDEGFVAGGGATMLYISNRLKSKHKNNVGYQLLLESIRYPFRQILLNGDINFAEVEDKIRKYGQLYDVKSKKIVDYKKSGIIDAKKSLRVALENAVSVTKLIINTKILSLYA